MGLFSKDIATMDDLLLHGLKDIYYAENQSQRGEGRRQKIVDGRVTQRGRRAVAREVHRCWIGRRPLERLQMLQHELF